MFPPEPSQVRLMQSINKARVAKRKEAGVGESEAAEPGLFAGLGEYFRELPFGQRKGKERLGNARASIAADGEVQ